MATTNMLLWNDIDWRRLDPVARAILLAWRMNTGEQVPDFCRRTGAGQSGVSRMSSLEGFEELQSILDDRDRLLRENEQLRHSLRYHSGAGS